MADLTTQSVTASWMTEAENEAVRLYAGFAETTIVEIGTFRGGTTLILLEASQPHVDVWSIDMYGHPLHTVSPEKLYLDRLRASARCFLIIGDSGHVGKFWTKDIGLLLIDGRHDGGQPKTDMLLWGRHVIPGGFLLIHDAAGEGNYMTGLGTEIWPQPEPKAIADYCYESLEWSFVGNFDTLAVFKRRC